MNNRTTRRFFLRFGLVLLSCCAVLPVFASDKVSVVVGVYPFAPFASVDKISASISGATVDLVDALNNVQNEYQFSLKVTSPAGRYRDFERGGFDLLMFENKLWGWQDKPVSSSRVYLQGREVYIALQQEARDESFFDDLASKIIIGVRGYHYGFAGFNSDTDHLKQNFNVVLTHSNKSSIRMLLGSRGDVAVVTQSNLVNYLKDNPDDANKILISKRLDQEYLHTILVRTGHSITAEKLNSWLNQLETKGVLQDIWGKWGL